MSRGWPARLRFPLVLLLTVLAALALFEATYRWDNKYTRASAGANGVLLLEAAAFEAGEVTFLTHGWEFYQYRHLTPVEIPAHAPDAYIYLGQYGGFELGDAAQSPRGEATYRLTVVVDDAPRDYALEIPEIYSAYRLYINGEEKASYGYAADGSYRGGTHNSLVAFTAAGSVEIVFAVTDHDGFYSGLTYPPAFGSPAAVSRLLGLRLALRGAALAVAVLIALLCLLVAAWQRFAGHTHLLALLCVCFVLYTAWPLVHTLPLPGAGWYSLEWLGYYGMFFTVLWLQGRLCGLPKCVYRPAMTAGALVCLSVLPARLLWLQTAGQMYAYSRLLSAYVLLAGLYLLATTALALWRGNAFSKPLLCGFAVFGAAVVYDRLHPLYEPVLLGWHRELAGFVLVLVVAGAIAWDTLLLHRRNRALQERERTALALLDAERRAQARQAAFAEQVRRLHHDRKNAALALQVYLRDGEYGRMEQLLAEELAGLDAARPQSLTGNPVVDALLGIYTARAAQAGLRLELTYTPLPTALALPEKELASLFTNILDNALDATAAVLAARGGPQGEAPRIRLDVAYTGGLLALECANPHTGVKKRGARYLTTKPDRAAHGYGLPILQELTARHGGRLEVAHTATEFKIFASVLTT